MWLYWDVSISRVALFCNMMLNLYYVGYGMIPFLYLEVFEF